MGFQKFVTRAAAAVLGLLVLGGSATAQVAKLQEVPPTPLTDVVRGQWRPLQPGAESKMFVITWGGDVATILAADDKMFGREMSLTLENDPAKQAQAVINGETPYFRGTLGMFNAALPAIKAAGGDMVVIVQLTWSNGADMMVVREGIRTPADLKGHDIALQYMGPHMDFAATILATANLTPTDVRFHWFKELTLPKQDTGFIVDPVSAFRADSAIEAVMCISPDGNALTAGGKIGTGADDSVKGARIGATSKATNRVIADVIAVRKDYLDSNRTAVEGMVNTLLRAQESLLDLQKASDQRSQQRYRTLLTRSAGLLLDAPQATADVEGMIADAEFVGHAGNVAFFTGQGTSRNFETLTREIQSGFLAMGIIRAQVPASKVAWDWNALAKGLKNTAPVRASVDSAKVAAKVESAIKSDIQGYIEDDTLFEKPVLFAPNQMDFDPAKYERDFAEALNLVETNAGAIVVVEGHMDVARFNTDRKAGKSETELMAMRQAARNQSLQRANNLRTRFLEYAKGKGIVVDENRIIAVGIGLDAPKNPEPGDDAAKKAENRRAVFRIRLMTIEE